MTDGDQPKAGLSLVDVLLQQPHLDDEVGRLVSSLHDLLTHDHDDERPFLTVLLRTQGERIEPLKDALLCLCAQTDEDFEVIVIDHDSDPQGASAVRRVVEAQPASFRRRIRVLEVSGGTRSRPLNAGVRESAGRYIAVYDDDDLLFANWVESFRAAVGPGGDQLLRAQAATQRARSEGWEGGLDGLRTLSQARLEYPRTFDQLDHLRVNQSPFMTFAFPRALFFRLGFEFDEELEVCEDWDLILRASLVLGVDDVPAITAIYRRWDDAESSYTRHSRDAWRNAEERVISRVNNSAILLPAGSVGRIRHLLSLEHQQSQDFQQQLQSVMSSRSWRWTAPMRAVRARGERLRRLVVNVWRQFGL